MGWTWLEGAAFDEAFKDFSDEIEREHEMERRVPFIEIVVSRLTNQRTEQEQEGWRRQADIEEYGYDTSGPDEFDNDEEEAQFELKRRLARAREKAEEQVLMDRLAELGARMMRKYEHWNEEEHLMAYLERDR